MYKVFDNLRFLRIWIFLQNNFLHFFEELSVLLRLTFFNQINFKFLIYLLDFINILAIFEIRKSNDREKKFNFCVTINATPVIAWSFYIISLIFFVHI